MLTWFHMYCKVAAHFWAWVLARPQTWNGSIMAHEFWLAQETVDGLHRQKMIHPYWKKNNSLIMWQICLMFDSAILRPNLEHYDLTDHLCGRQSVWRHPGQHALKEQWGFRGPKGEIGPHVATCCHMLPHVATCCHMLFVVNSTLSWTHDFEW